MTDMPDALSRRLFETLRLEIRYDHRTEPATCRVTLTSGSIDAIADMADLLPGRPGGAMPRTSEEEGMAAERKTSPATFCVAPRRDSNLLTGCGALRRGGPVSANSTRPGAEPTEHGGPITTRIGWSIAVGAWTAAWPSRIRRVCGESTVWNSSGAKERLNPAAPRCLACTSSRSRVRSGSQDRSNAFVMRWYS
ncbi:hypothetical protein ACFV80_39130 [Streptomyces sp. NPDC059862]|uniref:hypothetical protein n=1 Tax=Streptomyces sp. NPDC059862 TaxID=3346975 RepID=UPI00366467AE